MLYLSIAAPRTGSTRFGQLLQTMNVEFAREPFHPQAYIPTPDRTSGLRFYSQPYTLSDTGHRLLADPIIRGMMPARAIRMNIAVTKASKSLYQSSLACRRNSSSRAMDQLSRWLQKASERIGPAYNIFREPSIAMRVCELLDAMDGTLVLELFPGHLTEANMGTLCRTYPHIFHQRRLLDSYISLIKTDHRRWSRVDTTQRKATICPASFVDYCEKTSSYYRSIFKLSQACQSTRSANPEFIQSRPCVINYDDWSDHPNHQQSETVHALLCAQGFGDVFQKPIATLTNPDEDLIRQDTSPAWTSKVTNSEEVADYLTERSLESLLEARPLDGAALPMSWR